MVRPNILPICIGFVHFGYSLQTCRSSWPVKTKLAGIAPILVRESTLLIAPIVGHSHRYAAPVIHAEFQASFQFLAPDKFDGCTHWLGRPRVAGFALCR
ncbi:hypothetical protein WL14_10335 [Burkholderia cepacia]|nr:hypothetical protein WJ46_26500 [Burkholderia cepacia]KVQ26026.1 hypothetical protein WK02_25885 [Burkholderia cepacia]KVZ25651.1 hypothetical protein WL14_10335 [Burkholderia cepacia]